MRKLSDEDRQILLLREEQDLSYDAIAARLRVSVRTVKSRLHRARLALYAQVTGTN